METDLTNCCSPKCSNYQAITSTSGKGPASQALSVALYDLDKIICQVGELQYIWRKRNKPHFINTKAALKLFYFLNRCLTLRIILYTYNIPTFCLRTFKLTYTARCIVIKHNSQPAPLVNKPAEPSTHYELVRQKPRSSSIMI